jgi:hypothetical protein
MRLLPALLIGSSGVPIFMAIGDLPGSPAWMKPAGVVAVAAWMAFAGLAISRLQRAVEQLRAGPPEGRA